MPIYACHGIPPQPISMVLSLSALRCSSPPEALWSRALSLKPLIVAEDQMIPVFRRSRECRCSNKAGRCSVYRLSHHVFSQGCTRRRRVPRTRNRTTSAHYATLRQPTSFKSTGTRHKRGRAGPVCTKQRCALASALSREPSQSRWIHDGETPKGVASRF